MQIFTGVPLGGGVKRQWGCQRRQFLAIYLATSSTFSAQQRVYHEGDNEFVQFLT